MTISVSKQNNKRYKNTREYLFIFDNSESLTEGILFLYRLKLNLKSMLYKTESDYRLILRSSKFIPCFITLCEYCQRRGKPLETEYTKEHAFLLISKNAIETYGKCFFRET